MKKYIKFIYSLFFLFAVLVACDREKIDYGLDGEDSGYPEGLGKLNLSFQLAVETKVSDSAKDFKVKILNHTGNLVGEEYIYGNMPKIIELNTGSYTVVAESPNSLNDSQNPFYQGSQSFTIKKDEITIVDDIVCTMQNIKVEMIVEETLFQMLDNYDVTATFNPSSENKLSFSFDKTKGKSGVVYFPSITGDDVLLIQFKGGNSTGTISRNTTYVNVKGGEHRRITFTYTDPGINPDPEDGKASINLDVDATCEIVDGKGTTITVPGIKEPGTDPGNGEEDILIEGNGFDLKDIQYLDAKNDEPVNIIVSMTVPKGIANLLVEIVSDTLTPEELAGFDLSASFDLAYPGELSFALGEVLGFPVGDKVLNQEFLSFDITGFTPMLAAVGVGVSKFVLTVKDNDGNEKYETLTIEVVK